MVNGCVATATRKTTEPHYTPHKLNPQFIKLLLHMYNKWRHLRLLHSKMCLFTTLVMVHGISLSASVSYHGAENHVHRAPQNKTLARAKNAPPCSVEAGSLARRYVPLAQEAMSLMWPRDIKLRFGQGLFTSHHVAYSSQHNNRRGRPALSESRSCPKFHSRVHLAGCCESIHRAEKNNCFSLHIHTTHTLYQSKKSNNAVCLCVWVCHGMYSRHAQTVRFNSPTFLQLTAQP